LPKKKTNYVSQGWGAINRLISLPTFFKNITFFCVQQKKEMYTGLEQHEGV